MNNCQSDYRVRMYMTANIPDRMPDELSDRMPDKMSEYMEKKSEDMSDRIGRQNVR